MLADRPTYTQTCSLQYFATAAADEVIIIIIRRRMITRPTALVSSTRWSSYLRHAIEMGAQAAGIGLHKVK